MKKYVTSVLLCIFISLMANAKIFRLNFMGTPVYGVDYLHSDWETLETAATAGDTIQVYATNGNTITVKKRLVFIGFGYNLDINPGLQKVSTDMPSWLNIYFASGSDSSIAEGISGTFSFGNQFDVPTGIGVSKVIIRRCNGSFQFFTWTAPVTDIKIIGCVVIGASHNTPSGEPIVNLLISNSIVFYVGINSSGSTIAIINCVNNYISGGSSITLNNTTCLVRNCIFYYSGAAGNVNTVYENNFFGEAQPGTPVAGSNNRWGQDWGVLFNRLGGTNDFPGHNSSESFDEDYYILKAGSPAINGGFNLANQPTNCGIYGGEPGLIYKLSGVPSVPAIYKLEAPTSSASTNPYNVTISVRSNN